ncbi:hypothetical protein IE4872_PD01520 (plasmid) [Rhizobium gallicum]|uniref:Uncharacterized protein n=1 Tax=Rhizobium gallicum TaxID=56730 RepID=A0A1L5NVY7_9HYPH|nr:hypothetical protein IE4872_PD01520 [Rhizobium gallicum]
MSLKLNGDRSLAVFRGRACKQKGHAVPGRQLQGQIARRLADQGSRKSAREPEDEHVFARRNPKA